MLNRTVLKICRDTKEKAFYDSIIAKYKANLNIKVKDFLKLTLLKQYQLFCQYQLIKRSK